MKIDAHEIPLQHPWAVLLGSFREELQLQPSGWAGRFVLYAPWPVSEEEEGGTENKQFDLPCFMSQGTQWLLCSEVTLESDTKQNTLLN